jgi:hypothetical protein
MTTRHEIEVAFSQENNRTAVEQHDWCRANIAPYGEGWRSFCSDTGLIFSFNNEHHAVMFRLMYAHAPYNARLI